MLELTAHPLGTILPVHAQPGSRQTGIKGVHGGALKVSVSQPAEKGRANAAIKAVLAQTLGLRSHQVELLSGPTAARKRFLLHGLAPEQVLARLAAILGGGPG